MSQETIQNVVEQYRLTDKTTLNEVLGITEGVKI